MASPPRMRFWSKSFVACSNSSKLKIFNLLAISLFEVINCWRSNPWFLLKKNSLNFLAFCCLSLLVIFAAPRSENNRPKPALIAIIVIKPAEFNPRIYNTIQVAHNIFKSVKLDLFNSKTQGQLLKYTALLYNIFCFFSFCPLI